VKKDSGELEGWERMPGRRAPGGRGIPRTRPAEKRGSSRGPGFDKEGGSLKMKKGERPKVDLHL